MSLTSKYDRTRRVALFGGGIACLLGAAPTSRATSDDALSIRTPWCLPAQAAANAAGYLQVDNRGLNPDQLIEVTSPLAQRVSIHESRFVGGLATMTRRRQVAIPARTIVAFAPGGLHLMLETLRRPLDVGDRAPVTLRFKVAGQIRASLVVIPRPPDSAVSHMRM